MKHGHPIFPHGERVAVVEDQAKRGALGVAMYGGRFVVPLPTGYDQRTQVGWHMGWIFVLHPDYPPMVADTTTGNLSPLCEDALGALTLAYTLPSVRTH